MLCPETPEYAAGIAGAEVWKAVRMESESDLREALAFPCARIVADSGGGTGKRCRWDLASRLAAERSVFLAGGITPENVREAAGAVRPAGIDVSGGVEASPGIKDHRKIQLLADSTAFCKTGHTHSVLQIIIHKNTLIITYLTKTVKI